MSADGAQQGVSAGDALDVILGGKDPDDVGESTTAEMARRVMGTHLLDVDGDYGRMGDWTAHMYVDTAVLLGYFPDDTYAATKERLGEGSAEYENLTQISGFMHGWAENAARAILELPEVPNPALVTISIPEPR